MTPEARISAAISILDEVLAGTPAEPALIRWARSSRFAGSGDRAAVRDLVFDSLRRMRSRTVLGGAKSGRGLMLGMCREAGLDPDEIFSGQGFAPPPLTDDEIAHLQRDLTISEGEALDLPDWILPDLHESLGKDFQSVMGTMRDRAPVWLRVNTARFSPADAQAMLAADGIRTEPSQRLPSALRVTEGARRIAGSSALTKGAVELQDLSSQLAAAALPLTKDARVLDYCAGGGGKVLALAAREPEATYFAHDADPARMRDLPGRASRAGAKVTLAPTAKLRGPFDLVVVDAPCSGSGTWRRTPDAKWRLTPHRVAELIEIQSKILDDVAGLVKVGGAISYLTCSFLRAENEDVLKNFLGRRPDFSLQWQVRHGPLTAGDGFFASLLIKMQ